MPRPREFEPEIALEKAMRYFWRNGYYDTSIRDLIGETGVNFYGLYSVFGDKRGVYLNALDRYNDVLTKKIKEAVARGDSLDQSLRKAFDVVVDITARENGTAGCMMCNAAIEVAPHDEDVADRVRRHRKSLERAFRQRLDAAREKGELDGEKDIRALAEYLATNAYSVGLLVRSGTPLSVGQ